MHNRAYVPVRHNMPLKRTNLSAGCPGAVVAWRQSGVRRSVVFTVCSFTPIRYAAQRCAHQSRCLETSVKRYMPLPNANNAEVPSEKLRNYLLSPSHPVGRFKARFFWSIGYTLENSEALSEALLEIARTGEVEEVGSPYGAKFPVIGDLTGPTGARVAVVTIRISASDNVAPRFIAASPLEWRMVFRELDTVVLTDDLPEHGLRAGDLGAIVHVHESDGLEVEFVTASGRTEALVALVPADVRPVEGTDLVSVRSLRRSA